MLNILSRAIATLQKTVGGDHCTVRIIATVQLAVLLTLKLLLRGQGLISRQLWCIKIGI